MSVLLKQITGVDGEITAFARVGSGSYLVSVGGGSTLTVSTITNVASAAVLGTTSLFGFSAQSVAVFGDLVAVALQPTSSAMVPGTVRFYRIAANGSLTFLKDQAVGVLPDSLAFSADGSKLVVANEGQPNATYSFDPLGSISVINVADAGGPNPANLGLDAALLDFTGFAPPPSGVVDGTALRFSSSVPFSTTFAQDLEPEAIAISGNRAYVTLQENNGVAVVDLATRTIIELLPLGAVNYSEQFVDLTDGSGIAPKFGNRLTPGSDILGLRMPDGIASFVANGQTYFLTANEGDSRTDYGSTFNDEFVAPISTNDPDVSTIRNGTAPGGTASTTAFGSRSLSLFSASGELIWDSGVQLQSSAIGAGVYADSRSDAKGVEPEMVTLGHLNGRTYAFVGLERTTSSMVSVFDVSDPSAVDFVTSVVLQGSTRPEGLLFIDPASSPSGQALLVVANEGTNTIDILDAGALVAQDADRNPAGTYATSMLRDGAVDLSFKPLFTVGESTRLLEAGDKWNGQNRAVLNKDDKTNRGQAPQTQSEASYVPPGILDGLGAYDNGDGTYTVLANHELGSTAGYGYALKDFAAGEELRGARISRFIVDKDIDDNASNGFQSKVLAAGLAYERIFDAKGQLVTGADQLGGGLSRFCSSTYLEARSFGQGRGFRDDIYLTGEETSEGLMYALDVKTAELHAVPALGRAGWENATLIDTGKSKTVALLLADDNTAGLLLWVGTKGGNGFLAQNGMAAESGSLYTWKPAAGGIGSAGGAPGIPDSADLAVTAIGSSQAGSWVKVGSGSEVASWSEDQLKAKVVDVGGLQLSRIEDIHTNPLNGRQAVVATTGNGDFGAADLYGNLLTLDFSGAFDRKGLLATANTTSLRVIYDGDELTGGAPQAGVRNPDNLVWSADGFIYVQEDRSVPGGAGVGQFGSNEAAIWKLNPLDPITNPSQGVAAQRWAEIDPSTAPAAFGQTNLSPSTISANVGNWESSGIIDVSSLYGTAAGTFFLADVQAHSLRDGNLGGASYLTEGGQLTLIGTPALAFG